MAIENVNEKRNKIDGTVFESKTILVDGRVYKIVEDDTNFGDIDTIKPFLVYAFSVYRSNPLPIQVTTKENTTGGTVAWSSISSGIWEAVFTGFTIDPAKLFSPSVVTVKTDFSGATYGRMAYIDESTLRLYVADATFTALSSFPSLDFELRFYL